VDIEELPLILRIGIMKQYFSLGVAFIPIYFSLISSVVGSFDDLDIDPSGSSHSDSQGSSPPSQRQTLSGMKHMRSAEPDDPSPKHRDLKTSPLKHSRSMSSIDSQTRPQSPAGSVFTDMPAPTPSLKTPSSDPFDTLFKTNSEDWNEAWTQV
jgi:hypothetical protein